MRWVRRRGSLRLTSYNSPALALPNSNEPSASGANQQHAQDREASMAYLRWIEALSEYIGKLASYLILALVAAVGFDVIMRYLFTMPTAWAYDAALHLFAISFLMGGAWVLQMKAHVRVDVLYNLFPAKVRFGINFFFYIVLLFPLCYLLVKNGVVNVFTAWKMGEVSMSSPLHEPIWPLKAFIPISFFLLFLQGVVELVRDITSLLDKRRKGRESLN
jgi:TRAP-type mannitol/chloroaromatic compound transport system permease small subunit